MSTAVVYPATLPPPATMQVQGVERRAVAGMESAVPASARALQRDRQATATLAFKLDATQWAAWQVWWRLALGEGAAWFSAPSWVLPWGTGAVVQFTGQLQVTHQGAGLRQVEVQAQLRGAGQAPVQVTPPYPMTITAVTDANVADYGGELVAQVGALLERTDGSWQVPSLAYADPGAAPTYVGRFLPTRGALLTGAVQFRGTADTAGALGRLGFTVGVSSFVDAGAMFAAGYGTRRSRITGSSARGAISTFVWDEPITAVHVGVLGLGSYTVQNSGPVSAAAGEMLRLTFNATDEIRALYVHEGPPTNYAGTPGTGSARLVTVVGMQLP